MYEVLFAFFSSYNKKQEFCKNSYELFGIVKINTFKCFCDRLNLHNHSNTGSIIWN